MERGFELPTGGQNIFPSGCPNGAEIPPLLQLLLKPGDFLLSRPLELGAGVFVKGDEIDLGVLGANQLGQGADVFHAVVEVFNQ